MLLKMSSTKWRPFCSAFNVLILCFQVTLHLSPQLSNQRRRNTPPPRKHQRRRKAPRNPKAESTPKMMRQVRWRRIHMVSTSTEKRRGVWSKSLPVLTPTKYRKVSNIRRTLVGNKNCWSLRCSWSIACRRCSNYIFILNLTRGFNGLGKDNWKTRRETFMFGDWVCLIFENWRYHRQKWAKRIWRWLKDTVCWRCWTKAVVSAGFHIGDNLSMTGSPNDIQIFGYNIHAPNLTFMSTPLMNTPQQATPSKEDRGLLMMTSSNGNIFALLVICVGNSPVPGEFPAQMPVTRSFDVFFDLRLNNRLSKQSRGWWFETLSRPLWRHCNVFRYPSKYSQHGKKEGHHRISSWRRYSHSRR